MQTRDALDMALQEFSGALILVTHDQHLLESIVDQYWWVHEGQVQHHMGDLGSYLQKRLKQVKEQQNSVKVSQKTARPGENLNRKEQRQQNAEQRKALQLAIKTPQKAHKKVEASLQVLQETLADIHHAMEDSTLYESARSEELKELLHQDATLKQQIETLEEEWLLLEDEIEALTLKMN